MGISTKKLRKDIRWTRDNDSSVFISYSYDVYDTKKSLGPTVPQAIPNDVMQILNKLKSRTHKKKHDKLTAELSEFIMSNSRINKNLKRAFSAGKIDAETTLRKAGLIGGQPKQPGHPKTKCIKY